MYKQFYNLIVWQRANELTIKIYQATKDFPREELYGIINQIRRASSSVGANIAEGYGRFHYKDKVKFYYQARGSIVEVQNFVFLSKDLKYINKSECQELFKEAQEIEKLINGLIRSIFKKFSSD